MTNRRIETSAASFAIACVLAACSGAVDENGSANVPTDGLAGNGVAGSTPGDPFAMAGTGGQSGSGGALAGSGGVAANAGAGTGGMAGMAGSAGTDGMEAVEIALTALAANGTIGLDWSRIESATGYRVYWSSTPGVTSENGTPIEVSEPAYVHRALTNGDPYYYVVTALLPSGESSASPQASATPSGEWVLEQLGTGDYDDVVSGERVPRLPIEERFHVFLLPEGYLASDLAIFHDSASHESGNSDVDRWVAEVFALEPYSLLREAFVIWYLPRPSSAHAGQGDTAFDVALSGGSVGSVSAAAAPLWNALDDQGSDAFAFPVAAMQFDNFVAAFLIFDPNAGRAGYSGLMTTLRNPSDQQQSIRAAFARGHAHEFTHAFARVSDEYMETSNNGPNNPTETSNVTATNLCDELPWAHLLAGRGINETADLIGAFGSAELGYHSELHCLMNGTHDNGQFWCEPGDQRYTTLTLRPDRLCNFCREITAYRVFERTGVLSGISAFATWKDMYRTPFYERFGFVVPEGAIPQTVTCNNGDAPKPVYEACMP